MKDWKGDPFRPDPSLHEGRPELLAACPVCNPKPEPTPEQTVTFGDPLPKARISIPQPYYCTTGEYVPVVSWRNRTST